MSQIPILPANPAILQARAKWQYTGQKRPAFAQHPEPGQESVWDYPRPPRIETVSAPIKVMSGELVVAATTAAKRVLETAGAPTYYIPPDDIDTSLVEFGEPASICEWKGLAQSLHVDGQADAGWRYIQMFEEFAELYQWPSFYPTKLKCFVGEEQVTAQPGGYYGGWVTRALMGPIKGSPDSSGW